MPNKKVGLSIELAAIDKITQPIRLINRRLEKAVKPLKQFQTRLEAVGRVGGFNKVARNARRATSAINGVAGAMGKVAARGAGIAAAGGIGGFFLAKQFVDSSAKFEQTRVAFEVLFKDVEKGRVALEKLNQFSLVTPFEPDEVFKAGKILKGFMGNLTDDQIVKSLRNIGDVASILNQPLSEMTTIFGQIQSAGKLTGERLNQLAERAVPIEEALSKVLGRPKEEIRGLVSAGKVSAEAVARAFEIMTAEGGQFAKGMEKSSKTVTGRISSMIGFFDELKRKIGDELQPITTAVIEGMITLLTDAIGWVKANQEQIKAWVMEFKAGLPTLDEVRAFLIDLGRQLKQLWADMKPVRDLLGALIERFGIVKVGAVAFAAVLGGPLIIALSSAVVSMISLSTSVIGLAMKIPAVLTSLKGLALFVKTSFVPAMAAKAVALKSVAAGWLALAAPLLAVAKVLAIIVGVFVAVIGAIRMFLKWTGLFPEHLKNLDRAIHGFMVAPVETAKNAWDGLVIVVKNAFDFIVGKAKALGNTLKNLPGLDKIRSLGDSIGSGVGKIKNFFGGGDDAGAAPLPSENPVVGRLEAGRQNVNVDNRAKLDINIRGNTEGARVMGESDTGMDMNISRGPVPIGA